MSNILVLDLATHLGWTKISNGKIIDSGHLDLELAIKKENGIYKTGSKKGGIKYKKYIPTLNEQLQELDWFLSKEKFDKVVVEQPPLPNGKYLTSYKALLKTYSLHGILNFKYKEEDIIHINYSTWMKWIKKEYPPFLLYEEVKGKRKFLKKESSIIIANQILDKGIIDHNEADAICISHYFLKNVLS